MTEPLNAIDPMKAPSMASTAWRPVGGCSAVNSTAAISAAAPPPMPL